MAKFSKDVEMLLEYVGGKENIKSLSHCVTRLRFVLNDLKKADVEKIETLKSVKGTFTQSGQFQVIIGNEVSTFYNELMEYAGIDGVSCEKKQDASESKQTTLQKIMGTIGEIFAPLIPALICGGLILGVCNLIGEMAIIDGQTLAQAFPFFDGLYHFLWMIGDTIFSMLPVAIVWSITKKMGTTQMLGIVLGLTLVSPQLINNLMVNNSAISIPVWDFGFAQISMIGYQGQVIAAMMAGFVLVYLEKFFRKHCPEMISMIVVPFCSLLLAVLLTHLLVGPIGLLIGNTMAEIVYAGLTSPFGIIIAAIFGFLYAPIVITGLHHVSNIIDVSLATTFGGTMLWPMIALSNIAQASSVLAMSVLQKKNEQAKQINIPAMTSCYLGVSEPAVFGVNRKYQFPFQCAMIGSSIAAIVSVGFGVESFSIGVGGLPGIISIKPQSWIFFIIAMLCAIVVSFVLTLLVGQKKLSVKDKGETRIENKEEQFISPMSGKCYEISEIEDQAFASKAMGEGIAIDLSDGKVIAPFSGIVMVVFPTKHAYGLKCDNGKEILIHIGMNSVTLNGEGFTSFVKVNDRIKQGDMIASVDVNLLKAKHISLISPVVFTDKTAIEVLKNKEMVSRGEANILAFKQEATNEL